MAYEKKIRRFPNATEIAEFHSARYGAPGEERASKKKATPEQMKKRNQWNKERMARWKLRNNFDINDYFALLTYKKDARPPDMNIAKKHFAEFCKYVRKEYKKRGHELKWMRNIEVGTKNGWHIHLVINRIPDTDLILKKAWKYGKVIWQLLHEKGEFAELASYITKTPDTDKSLRETSYSTSRNLPVPEPEKKVYRHWKTWNDIKIPEGFYLDKNSLHEDINPFTGFRYRTYTLLRLDRISVKDCRTKKKRGKVT